MLAPVYEPAGGLNPDYVIEIWKSIENPSLAKVAVELAKRGILSPRTGRPYTRQNLHLRMLLSEEGRQIFRDKRPHRRHA